MATLRAIVINEPLCFLTRKFGRYASKQIKSIIFDFYAGDIISTAKDVLFNAITNLKIVGLPKLVSRRRRDSKEAMDVKIRLDIDDLVSLMVFVDEGQLLDQLPIFVAADPDLIPSSRMLEGDMAVVLSKLSSIEERCHTMQRELDANRALAAERLARSTITVAPGVIPGSTVNPFIPPRMPAESTASLRRTVETSSAQDSEADMTTDNFAEVVTRSERRRRTKRLRASFSPASPSFASAVKSGTRGASAPSANVAAPTPLPRLAEPKKVVIGHSTTSTMRAAKVLNVTKAVFRIGNIDSCYSADDVKSYVESLGVRVMSCFERTSENTRFVDNKSFRICIFDADKALLLCESNWFVGISIQRWVFKPKDVNQGATSGGRVGTVAEDGAKSGSIPVLDSPKLGESNVGSDNNQNVCNN
jgi:hypothetical protein